MGFDRDLRRHHPGRSGRHLSHGVVSGALFLCVGVVYDRCAYARDRGLWRHLVNLPFYAVAFMIFTLANVALPGTSGFIGEFLTLIGTFRVNTSVAAFATVGTILSAAYALWLYRRHLRRRPRQARARRHRGSTTAR